MTGGCAAEASTSTLSRAFLPTARCGRPGSELLTPRRAPPDHFGPRGSCRWRRMVRDRGIDRAVRPRSSRRDLSGIGSLRRAAPSTTENEYAP